MAVEGRLDWREWEAKDGSGKRQAVQIIANSVQFLGSRDGSGGGGGNGGNGGGGFTPSSDVPADTSDFEGAAAGRRRRRAKTTSPSSPATAPAARGARAGASVGSARRYGYEPERLHRSDQRGAARRGADRARPRKYTRINSEAVDYKDLNLLRRFLSDKGKTRGRRVTGLSRKHQRQLSVAVKRAREIALLPYVGER